jgi:hypothetical protein
MPDETTFELASVHFGAEPVAVFRFGYERFELRARLGPGNLEHAIAAAAEVAASVFARWSHEALAFAQRGSRWRGRRASASLGRAPRTTARGVKLSFNIRAKPAAPHRLHNKTSPIEWPAASTARQTGVNAGLAAFHRTAGRLKVAGGAARSHWPSDKRKLSRLGYDLSRRRCDIDDAFERRGGRCRQDRPVLH